MGYIIRGPLGGLVWHHLQYLVGLANAGHQVLFYEDSDDYPSCYRPGLPGLTTDPAYGLSFARKVLATYGFRHQWTYYDAHRNQWHGLTKNELFEFIDSADLIINLSASNPLREWFRKIPKRVIIDTDPVFTQIRHLTKPGDSFEAGLYTSYFTFGENYESPDCQIPKDGFNWKPTRQPVVMDLWSVNHGKIHGSFTTVMQWDSYNTGQYNGISYGMKSQSFQEYLELPKLCTERFELAIGGSTTTTHALSEKGWRTLNPLRITKSPANYQEFIQASKAEWSVAKEGYVKVKSGWFSERSTCYLASGRPVLIQDTGFSKFLQTGKGLLHFSSLSEALAGVEEINKNYTQHCNWAREIATEFFRADKVLSFLLERVFQGYH